VGVARIWKSPLWKGRIPQVADLRAPAAGGSRTADAPSLADKSQEGYGGNLSSGAGLVLEQDLVGGHVLWASIANKGQRAWVLWCSWVPSRMLNHPGTRCPVDRAAVPEETTESLRVQVTQTFIHM
jgi:hypothetical protein